MIFFTRGRLIKTRVNENQVSSMEFKRENQKFAANKK